jgi:hypothetical protein
LGPGMTISVIEIIRNETNKVVSIGITLKVVFVLRE